MAAASGDQKDSKSQPPPANDRMVLIDPLKIRFTQKQASKKFSCGRSVCDAITALRNGSLSPSDLPHLHCVAISSPAAAGSGGDASSPPSVVYWSLDNRRLFALQQWAKYVAPQSVTVRIEVVPTDSEFTKKRSNRDHGKSITISNLTIKEQLLVL